MIQDTEKKALNYYELRLKLYLKDYHPHLLGNEEFITARTEAAAETHERVFLSGSNPYEAHHESIEVLLESLEHSPYLILEDLLEEMGVPEEVIPPLALRLTTSPEAQSLIAEEGEKIKEDEKLREWIRSIVQQTT